MGWDGMGAVLLWGVMLLASIHMCVLEGWEGCVLGIVDYGLWCSVSAIDEARQWLQMRKA